MKGHLAVGQSGEDLAAGFLKKRGLKIVERNHRTPYGEIDLICLDRKTVVFVEVKTRTSDAFGRPSDAVGPSKMKKLSRAASSYLADKRWDGRNARFDVVSIDLSGDAPHIDHIADAFDLVG